MTDTPSSTAAAVKPGRLQWIDSARGACVLAVVLFHVCLWQYLPLQSWAWGPAADAWTTVNGYLGSLRMPVLLALSGMLAARRIKEGWGKPGAAVRAASSYYLYVVWLVVYFAFYLAVSGVALPHRIDGIGAFLVQLLVPETPLWYVFALALYVVVLTSVRRVPPWMVISVLAVMSILVLVLNPNWPMFEKVPENAVFFAIGVYAGPQLQNFAARRKLTDLALWLFLGLISILAAKWSYGDVGDAIVHVLRGGIFVVLGITVVVNLIRWRPLGRLGEFIGRRTLQIYVLHAPLIMIVLAVTDGTSWLKPVLAKPALAIVWPLLLTALIVTATLLIHRLLMLARLGFLFQMPAALSTFIYRTHTRVSDKGQRVAVDQSSTVSPSV